MVPWCGSSPHYRTKGEPSAKFQTDGQSNNTFIDFTKPFISFDDTTEMFGLEFMGEAVANSFITLTVNNDIFGLLCENGYNIYLTEEFCLSENENILMQILRGRGVVSENKTRVFLEEPNDKGEFCCTFFK